MKAHLRRLAWFVSTATALFAISAAADDEGAPGYGDSTAAYQLDVSHDGYPRSDQAGSAELEVSAEAPHYVVIEVEEGTTQEVEGEAVIVVQEPEPVAATDVAPPPPRVAAVQQPVLLCPGGIWVDGYWAYGDGQYIWIDGHCVVERVNYVFVHPRWDFYANVWWFVPGYFRPCGVWVSFGYHRPLHWFPPYHRPYYRRYRGVPVHRGVPRRPTVARPAPRPTVRGVTPSYRVPAAGRVPPTRAPALNRVPPTRAPAVNRLPATRAHAVNRVPPTRAHAVNRVPPTRAHAVNRVPPTRAPAVNRVPPTRAPAVNRVPPTRAPAVNRVPPTQAPAASRLGGRPALTNTVPRAPRNIVSQPRVNPTRTPAVTGSPSGRPPSARPRVGGFGSRPSSGMFGRPGQSLSRPSFGRPGGFARPSSGGFGGARSVPTARGR